MSRPLLGTLGTPKQNHTGSWIDAAFDSIQNIAAIELHMIYMTSHCDEIIERIDRHYMYKLPREKYANINKISNWDVINEKIHPDLIMVWGTEQDVAIPALMYFHNIPKIIYIQGFLDSIVRNFYAGLTPSEILKTFSIFDIARLKFIPVLKHRYEKRANNEKKSLALANAIILENDWCAGQIRMIAPHCRIFKSLLPIRREFFNYDWHIDKFTRHTVFANAGGLPLKGHHTLIKAMSYVVQYYPDAQLMIPGTPIDCSTIHKRIRTLGYHQYLFNLIKKYNLENNIHYLGILPTYDDMAKTIASCNVFVMPSYVENHSSSLIEAMIIGAPCVATYVGGVQTITQNNENALIYNSSDPIALADDIIRIFESDGLAQKLSNKAKEIRTKRNVDIGQDLMNIYTQMLK